MRPTITAGVRLSYRQWSAVVARFGAQPSAWLAARVFRFTRSGRCVDGYLLDAGASQVNRDGKLQSAGKDS